MWVDRKTPHLPNSTIYLLRGILNPLGIEWEMGSIEIRATLQQRTDLLRFTPGLFICSNGFAMICWVVWSCCRESISISKEEFRWVDWVMANHYDWFLWSISLQVTTPVPYDQAWTNGSIMRRIRNRVESMRYLAARPSILRSLNPAF